MYFPKRDELSLRLVFATERLSKGFESTTRWTTGLTLGLITRFNGTTLQTGHVVHANLDGLGLSSTRLSRHEERLTGTVDSQTFVESR
jgi:hypothetical protein